MNGLSIKRIAAIGLGAALVGSALAPVVSAANVVPTGLANLTKVSVIDATGAPAVDVVVGANAAVSDVVWAGNIAARVAQLATKSAGASTGAASVDVTVGGTVSTAGNGLVTESVVSYGSAEADLQNIQVTDSKMTGLVNETSADLTWAGVDITTTIKEVLRGSMDVEFQKETSSSKYAVGELYAAVNAGDLNYSVELGAPLNINTSLTNLDGNSDYDVKLPWLGKVYRLDEVKSSGSLVMYADTTPTDLEVGQKITVTPASGYAGKTMEIQLVDLIQIGSGNQTYEPKWALIIDGVSVKYIQKKADSTYDLREQFGKSYFTDNVYVTSAGLNLAANKYTATIRTGSERLELKNGKGYPFVDDSTIDDKAQWKVVLDTNGTAGYITKIRLVNQWSYKKTSGSESDTSKYVLKTGEEVKLPADFAAFKFVGLQTKASKEVIVGDVSGIEGGGIQYVDLRGNTVKVPFYKQFDLEYNDPTEIQIQGKDYTVWIDSNKVNSYQKAVYYTEGKQGDAISHVGWSAVDVNYNQVQDAQPVMLDLGAETKNGVTVDTNYGIIVDASDALAGLVLLPQTFNIENKADSTSVPTLDFVDTNNGQYAFYAPHTEDFAKILANISTYDSGSYESGYLYYTDNEGDYVDMYVRTGDTATVWDYESIKNEDSKYGPTTDAVENDLGWEIRDSSDYLQAGITTDGTTLESDNSVFTITVPEETRNAEVYIGGTGTSTTTVGGTAFTGLADKASETKGNVTVTINAINGTGSASGVTVVPVGSIVRTSKQSGKSIIVGGWVANAAAKNLQVSAGATLESLLTTPGDYVAAVTPSGDIVVAGMMGTDTGMAAQELITALEGLM